MVPIRVGANRIAAHAEILLTSSFCARLASVNDRISSFCRCPTRVAFTVSAVCSNSRNASPRSTTRCTWSATSRRLRRNSMSTSYLSNPRSNAAQHVRQRVGGPLELDDLPGQFVDPPGHRGVAVEKLVLDLVDVVLQAGDPA